MKSKSIIKKVVKDKNQDRRIFDASRDNRGAGVRTQDLIKTIKKIEGDLTKDL